MPLIVENWAVSLEGPDEVPTISCWQRPENDLDGVKGATKGAMNPGRNGAGRKSTFTNYTLVVAKAKLCPGGWFVKVDGGPSLTLLAGLMRKNKKNQAYPEQTVEQAADILARRPW